MDSAHKKFGKSISSVEYMRIRAILTTVLFYLSELPFSSGVYGTVNLWEIPCFFRIVRTAWLLNSPPLSLSNLINVMTQILNMNSKILKYFFYFWLVFQEITVLKFGVIIYKDSKVFVFFKLLIKWSTNVCSNKFSCLCGIFSGSKFQPVDVSTYAGFT